MPAVAATDGEAAGHVGELADGRVGEHAFEVVLGERGQRGAEHRDRGDDAEHGQRGGEARKTG